MDIEDKLYVWYKVVHDGVEEGMKNMNPQKVISLLVAFFSLSSAQQKDQIFDTIGKGLQREIVAAKLPVVETIATVGSSQCKHVKKLVGVSYEQLAGENEPDLNLLRIFYKNRQSAINLNISEAAGWLRQARQFERDNRLIIFVHGFTDNPMKDSFTNISSSFLKNNHNSVLALDGSSLIRWLYLRSTTYVRFIGRSLAEFLAVLVGFGQDPSQIHIIGHSLGAHIAGFTGKTFQELTRRNIGRISGLDPAGPCFSHVEPELRLKHTDADFVDVIHTDAGVYGIKDAVGHVDYYPNSGAMQPDCVLQTCSHSRAWLLYGVSIISPEAFPAVRCQDWDAFKKGQCENEISYMGYSAKPGTRGQYYLRTGDTFPYSLGKDGLRYVNNEGIVQSIGNIFG
ncbi:pancreatic triacylglycerol lipase-like isoform X1 [Colias croceus]|uniref:pancreatic triacylglycerol lipase-like isoform X1 n=2 Tax=Colias crocea TaxID=72248 RepID=UPI001E27D7CD|nr:pancreatic triacylglycerol lipase-like isoform X1 [Colias croceus]